MSNQDEQQVLIDNRRKGWFWDYNEVFGSGLSVYAIAVRLYISRRANKSLDAWPSLNTIAKDCNISRPTVVKALCELESKGWIRRTVRKSNGEYNTTIYHLEDPPLISSSGGGCKGDLQPCKNITGVVNDINNLVNDVDNPVNCVNYPCKGDLQGVVNDVDQNNTHIRIPIDQQQHTISDHPPIIELTGEEKDVVVEDKPIPTQDEIQELIEFALEQKPREIKLEAIYAGEIIRNAGSLIVAKEKIEALSSYIANETRSGREINNLKGAMIRVMAKDTGGIKLGRRRSGPNKQNHLAEKEEKYRDVYIT